MAFLDSVSRLMGRRVPPAQAAPGLPADMSSLLASLLSMAWFVEARDPYTGGHLWRVSRYAQAVARQMSLGRAAEARIGLGGFLHDLGKIGIADAILRKPDRLTDEEYDVVKTHPSMGARPLAGHPLAELVIDALRLHHERPDGNGYPLGLSGDDIPIMARIVGVCDAFDAMTSHRPYRSGMPVDRALAIIASEKGQQFDAQAAEALLELGRRDELRHIIGHSQEGIPLQHCGNCGPTLVLTLSHVLVPFGNRAASSGTSLPIIGKVLNHKTPEATKVYARLMVASDRNAMEEATAAMRKTGEQRHHRPKID